MSTPPEISGSNSIQLRFFYFDLETHNDLETNVVLETSNSLDNKRELERVI